MKNKIDILFFDITIVYDDLIQLCDILYVVKT